MALNEKVDLAVVGVTFDDDKEKGDPAITNGKFSLPSCNQVTILLRLFLSLPIRVI